MLRKLSLLLVTLIIAANAVQVQAAQSPKGQVSFYAFGDSAEKAAYETLIAAFNKKYPDIAVKLVFTPGEDEIKFGDAEDAYRQRLSLDFASNTPPDVFLMNYREYGIFEEKGVLEPLAPYLAKSTLIKSTDFYPEVLPPFTRDGQLVCIPQNASGVVVYYNKALFDAAKVDYPKAGWTWDDFLKTAKALTKDTNGDGKVDQYGLAVQPDITRLMPFIWQNGGELVDNVAAPTKLDLDTPEVKAAFQWFVDLQGKEKVAPDELQSRAQSINDRFASGTVGMLIFSRRIVPTLRQVKFDWDVAPLPQNKKAATLLYSDGYCMSKASKNKDATWTLIEYANSPEGQSVLAKTGRTVPSLKAVAESADFLAPTEKPANSKLFLDIIPNIRTSPALDKWADIEEQLNAHLEEAYYGDKSVDDAIEEIMNAVNDPNFKDPDAKP
ncbi:MAG: sugar ABC transporter substrate-binding protein [Chloroflexota bacterium]